MSKTKNFFHYLRVSILFAVLAVILLSAAGGFLAKPQKLEVDHGVVIDENSLDPTKIEPVEAGDRLTPLITYTLDASDVEKWTYFDFSRGGVVEDAEMNSLDWDLAFRRARILTNSGANNKSGKGGAMAMESKALDKIAQVPENKNFEIDYRPYNKAENENPALAKWYNYNYINHRLDPKPEVYIIKTADGRFAKIRILTYYCRGEKAGCYTIQYVYQGGNSTGF
ncbi:MAG: HmuY family protein [Nitrospinae bacterium]|nr:HmuY family protein [Nitrospinota bacterium]